MLRFFEFPFIKRNSFCRFLGFSWLNLMFPFRKTYGSALRNVGFAGRKRKKCLVV
uniref:Uncharacterized protein n=1 Tax=uncultured bacterium 2M03 TaxID=1701359 RepID=A0A0M4C1S3_9BACT|nr:hypothetical protein [uncultured bacterium 2M03]